MPKLDLVEIDRMIRASGITISQEEFIRHARRYIAASKAGGLMVREDGKSVTGGPTKVRFFELSKRKYGRQQTVNFNCFMQILGYKPTRDGLGVKAESWYASGMHSNTIRKLLELGLVTDFTADKLGQYTPHSV